MLPCLPASRCELDRVEQTPTYAEPAQLWIHGDPSNGHAVVTGRDGSASDRASGSEPSWSPDGERAVLLAQGLQQSRSQTQENYSFRVRGRTGEALFTLSAPGLRFGREAHLRNGGRTTGGPQWTTDGRYLVVGVFGT